MLFLLRHLALFLFLLEIGCLDQLDSPIEGVNIALVRVLRTPWCRLSVIGDAGFGMKLLRLPVTVVAAPAKASRCLRAVQG
jgi:hypothetical protein